MNNVRLNPLWSSFQHRCVFVACVQWAFKKKANERRCSPGCQQPSLCTEVQAALLSLGCSLCFPDIKGEHDGPRAEARVAALSIRGGRATGGPRLTADGGEAVETCDPHCAPTGSCEDHSRTLRERKPGLRETADRCRQMRAHGADGDRGRCACRGGRSEGGVSLPRAHGHQALDQASVRAAPHLATGHDCPCLHVRNLRLREGG